MIIITFVLFAIYASLEGIRDAFVFTEYYKRNNIHWLLFSGRLIAGILASVPYFLIGETYTAFVVLFMLGLMFPMFQLTAYYETQSLLGHPFFNWLTDRSSSSNARFSFTFIQRLLMFNLAICILLFLLIF